MAILLGLPEARDRNLVILPMVSHGCGGRNSRFVNRLGSNLYLISLRVSMEMRIL